MLFYLHLAWRNIWRNKRRSLISIASVLFAVIVALATRSMQLGFYGRMIDNVVSFYTGYAQVQAEDYFDTHSLDDSFLLPANLLSDIQNVKSVTAIAPRLESFGLICSDSTTTGAMIVGIDPRLESNFSHIDRRVKQGYYLDSSDNTVLLATGLANQLKVLVGDTIIVLSQGFSGSTAAGKYTVAGLIDFPSPDLASRLMYLSLPVAQELFSADGRITSLAVMVDKPGRQTQVIADIRNTIENNLVVISWQEILPELIQYIEMDNASGIVMLIIIYIVIGFGILGTILMMTLERNREFGMLIAIGMKRSKIRIIILIESIILSFIGAISGVIAGIPILLFLFYNPIRLTGEMAMYMEVYGFEPIMPFSLDPMIFIWQTISVLIIALIVAIYPLLRIGRIEPASALRTG